MQSLSDEMLKLKSATKNYEETRGNLSNMCESIDKISATHQKLTDNMSQFLAEIKKMNYREQTDKILEQGENQAKALSDLITERTDSIIKNHQNQSKALSDGFTMQTNKILQDNESRSKALGDDFREQTGRILQSNESQLGEIRDLLKKQADRMLEHYESQSKALRLVKYLVALGVLMQAAAIIGILLR